MRARTGVSLLAIVITLAGVALIAGLAIPLWFSRHQVTLDNAALLLARDLRAAQGRAAILGEPVTVLLHEHGWKGMLGDGEPLMRMGGSEPLARELDADGVFEGVTLAEIRFGPGEGVDFSASGEALESGAVELRFRGESRRLVLTAPQAEIVIEGLHRARTDGHP